MKKPYVICHMMSTIDGRIISANWGDNAKKFGGLYEQCHRSFESQAWMVGRVTMEKDFTNGEMPLTETADRPIARSPFVGDKSARTFAIAVDPKGKLGWTSNEIDGDHIIEILTESVSDEYLNYLIRRNISFIFAGKDQINFKSALTQLADLFLIQTIMLEGGGHINGSVLNEGLIDEISLLLIPLVDGTINTPSTFDVSEYLSKNPATQLKLNEIKQLEHDVLWLRYSVLYND